MLSCPKVFTIGRALGIHVRKSDLELFKLAAARLPHTQLVRLVVKKMENMSCRWGDQQLRRAGGKVRRIAKARPSQAMAKALVPGAARRRQQQKARREGSIPRDT